MSRSARIRAWMRENPGAHTSGEIAAAIGEEKPIKVAWALAALFEAKMVAREPGKPPHRYTLVREPLRRIGAERELGPAPAPRDPKPRPTPAQHIVIAPTTCPTRARPPVEERETVEQWMARTGKKPERLPTSWDDPT